MFKTLMTDFKNLPRGDQNWLVIWSLIYVTFLTIDAVYVNFWGSSVLKYIGIFLCIVYAYHKSKNDAPLILALFFTFLADTILVWTKWEVFGVFCFCFAQFMHLIRHGVAQPKYIGIFTLLVAIFFIYSSTQNIPAIYGITAIYGIMLITNVVLSIGRYNKNKKDLYARYGMYGFIAFAACDFCVGIRHLMLDGAVSTTALPLVAYLVWVFYYPSQVLIANSSNKTPTDTKLQKAKD